MEKSFKSKTNFTIFDYLNLTTYHGRFELPNVSCNCDNINVDYLALCSQTADYVGYSRAVCFYQYDFSFDGIHGLFNAIYFNDQKLLKKYRERFSGVRVLIAPDYSLCGDVSFVENLYRIFKARVVAVYMVNAWDKIVIPNITFVDERTKDACFDGIDRGSIVAISAKGCLKSSEQRRLFEEIVDQTIKRVSPPIVVIYNVATKSKFLDGQIYKLERSGAKVLLPDNKLLERNKTHMEGNFNGQI